MHDYARRLTLTAPGPGGPMGVAAVTSVDAMFKRKRGRPPKNRVIEVRHLSLPPYELFSSLGRNTLPDCPLVAHTECVADNFELNIVIFIHLIKHTL